MDFIDWFQNPAIQPHLLIGLAALIGILPAFILFLKLKKARRIYLQVVSTSTKMKAENESLLLAIRARTVNDVLTLNRIIKLFPIVLGKTPEETTLESRNRSKCLSFVIEGLSPSMKSQGIRLAELTHEISNHLVLAFGKEGIVNIAIDVQQIILDIDSAASMAIMINELLSNALQYAPVPGERSKVSIVLKERDNKIFLIVGDNGIGMKSPYVPKFLFGLQLVNTLVQKHKGEMIFSSRPGTRIEIILNDYQKADREVFVTPTTRVH